jgi:hypothetical protein
MFEQTLIVALLVAGCSVYAAWRLMPSAARRGVATLLLRLPLPARLSTALQKLLVADSGCGCDGCDKSTLKKNSATDTTGAQPIRFHPRLKR